MRCSKPGICCDISLYRRIQSNLVPSNVPFKPIRWTCPKVDLYVMHSSTPPSLNSFPSLSSSAQLAKYHVSNLLEVTSFDLDLDFTSHVSVRPPPRRRAIVQPALVTAVTVSAAWILWKEYVQFARKQRLLSEERTRLAVRTLTLANVLFTYVQSLTDVSDFAYELFASAQKRCGGCLIAADIAAVRRAQDKVCRWPSLPHSTAHLVP